MLLVIHGFTCSTCSTLVLSVAAGVALTDASGLLSCSKASDGKEVCQRKSCLGWQDWQGFLLDSLCLSVFARSHDFIVNTCAHFMQKVCRTTSDWKSIWISFLLVAVYPLDFRMKMGGQCFGNSLGTSIFGVDCTEHTLSENLIVLSSKENLKQMSGYKDKVL
jgi:hypothetical protein